jgi:hypothetical protein
MTVARLALRELWISYRLMLVLAGFVATGAIVALVPVNAEDQLNRLAFGFAVAGAVAGIVSAWSLASERRRRRAGWLVGRGVPRASIVSGWFAALALAVVAGLVPSAVLAWLALLPAGPSEAVAYAAAVGAVGCGVLAVVAFGQLVGAILPPLGAVTAVILFCAAVAAASTLAPQAATYLPSAGYVVLANLADTARPVARAFAGGGVVLATTGALLLLATAAFERVDL